MRYPLLFIFLFIAEILSAQETTSLYNFALLRQNDRISLHDVENKNIYQKLKSIRLGEAFKLSFGGSYRFQSEAFVNEEFSNQTDQNDIWFLQRTMIHGHLQSDNFEVFAELNSSLITSKQNLSPVDRDELSFNQLYTRYHFNEHWNLLLGRQNIRLGSGRLVDIREGPNVRLSFDMAQLQYVDEKTSVTAFHSMPVQQKEGVFDNDFLENNESLSTLYWTQNWTDKTNTDIYILYKKEELKQWNIGTADDNRASIGVRHFGQWNGLKYNNEFVYQFGKFGDLDISAWTASFNIEKEISSVSLGVKTEAISGNNDNNNSLNTFDGLYPRGAYFGRVARFGPSNLIDLHPYFEIRRGKWSIQMDYVAFWRFSKNDGVYGPAMQLSYADTNDRSFIAHQIGSIAGIGINSHLAFELEGNIIFPGSFLNEGGFNKTLYHLVFTAEFKF